MSQEAFWQDFVVHLPHPERLDHKGEILKGVRYFLLVGSLKRPQKIASMAARELGMKDLGPYFHLCHHPEAGDREFHIHIVDLNIPSGEKAAIISHGIGMSGVEISIFETLSLVHWVEGFTVQESPVVRIIGRSGTRGTLKNIDYGTMGISTASFSDRFDVSLPDPHLVEACRQIALEKNYAYALGLGMSTSFFWTGQGRSWPFEAQWPEKIRRQWEEDRQKMLWDWVKRGIAFVEMEDYSVHHFSHLLNIPSITLGTVVARRYDPKIERFGLDYDAAIKKKTELRPAEVLLELFRKHALGQISTIF